ncbi:MAG: SUMF1/EgtB/PvdO family nonheme iron enzyme, partial [Acidobacteria bacterium]|nr:SUMF1/EgtB/PvdO family nonheme iron enzyme [Acidobacteriota bacterium]
MKKTFISAILIIYFAVVLPGQIKGVTDKVVMFNGESVILYEKSYALLIGVSKYKYWPTLENIPSELQLLGSSLGNQGFIISKCLNPDCKQLKEAIENFINANGLKQGNRLLIFFSGHGYTRMDGKKGYIVPADADNPKTNEMGFVQKAVEMEQIVTWARRIEARHALFVFDSCFSGTVFQSKTSPAPAYVSYLTGKSVRQFITAGSAGETVPAESRFTKCFARGIEGEADEDSDGYITGTELGLYLQKKITGYKIGQTPQVGKIRDPELDQGDFVFINQLPSAPKPVDIEVSSLQEEAGRKKQEREVQTGWANWQNKFRENVEKLKLIAKDPDISLSSQKQKWQELLNAYRMDNPYSDEDEQLRNYAEERMINLQKGKDNPFGEEINKQAKDIYKNSSGSWEADHGDGIVMIYIPEGEFTMGSNDKDNDEKPPHTVYLDGYWIGKYEVTFAQYDRYCEETGKQKPDDRGWGRGERPVIHVSWDEAAAYCKWLSQKTGLKFQLPTEAQWEKAARGSRGFKYPWGNDFDKNNCNFIDSG